MASVVRGVTLQAPEHALAARILTPGALGFLADLHRRFEPRRQELLRKRQERYAELARGKRLAFLSETKAVRDAPWTVAAAPADLQDRRCEITGPTDRKMMINAFNSGSRVFMADFEDANVPTWPNLVDGQANLIDAVERRLDLTTPDGKKYKLNATIATLVVRPRGWHLSEKHVLVEGAAMSGSLFDAGLFLFHCGKRLEARGSGPYFYLPKMEGHLEARLWADVFRHAEAALGLGRGAIKCTVLIETILAAFEMDEILYELRDHSCALNAGRWDYMFSIIKKFRDDGSFAFPDRAQLTMTVPFMRAYTELLVKTCHARGAHAIGGMAAFIPSRKDPAVNEIALARVREDKERESRDGFDGTWVAHPDLVPVATEVFDPALGSRPNQLARRRDDVQVTAEALVDFHVKDGVVTEAGVRANVGVGIRYLESWLRGVGAAAINNLMEDAATAEIARSQLWHWVQRRAATKEGTTVTPSLVRRIVAEEMKAAAADA
ncbi:MAG TPA: malate synthase A, partial [Candidatus Thermoplasmatota archaeon]|nr:malate synthase A [Candidatus Thermoplasmatota archaeon]